VGLTRFALDVNKQGHAVTRSFLSHVIQHTHKRAERRARNIAGAEALAVARRPEVASREKDPAAAGIRRFFPLSK